MLIRTISFQPKLVSTTSVGTEQSANKPDNQKEEWYIGEVLFAAFPGHSLVTWT